MSATWKAKPQDVERLLGSVLPHASNDEYLPMITVVSLEVEADRIIAAATDRYTLGIGWELFSTWDREAEAQEPVKACIYAADIRRLIAFLKAHRKSVATWELSESGLTVSQGGESLTVKTVDVNFVKWRPLFGSRLAASATGVPVMRFSPTMVDHFLQSAKVLGESFGSMTWHFGSLPTDAPFVKIGDRFIGLLMPQRIEESLPALDLSVIGITPNAIAA